MGSPMQHAGDRTDIPPHHGGRPVFHDHPCSRHELNNAPVSNFGNLSPIQNFGIHFHPATINKVSTMRVNLHSHWKCQNRQVSFVHFLKTNGLPLHDKTSPIFRPTILRCFGFSDTYIDQGIFQLQMLLSHLRCCDKLGLLIWILVETLHLIIGLPKDPFTYSSNIFRSYVEQSWITSTWEFISSLKGAIHLKDSPSARIRCKCHADMDNSTLELNSENSQKAECLLPLSLRDYGVRHKWLQQVIHTHAYLERSPT